MKIYEISCKCRLSFSEETPGAECESLTIDAVIPGNVELDLERAGILPDLFFGNNIKLLRKYEYYKWRYTIDADFPAHAEDEQVILEFCGVDCFADYYLNGVRFGESDNALIPHRFDVTGLCHEGKNLLEVVIRSPLLEAAKKQYDAYEWAYVNNHEALRVRKAPSQYGWDIMPRAVTAGIWRPVKVIVMTPNEFIDFYITTLRADRS